jgi:hypothetical protein
MTQGTVVSFCKDAREGQNNGTNTSVIGQFNGLSGLNIEQFKPRRGHPQRELMGGGDREEIFGEAIVE